MSVGIRAVLAVDLGIVVLKLVFTGGYHAYVRPRMGALLVAASAALIGVACVDLVGSVRSSRLAGARAVAPTAGGPGSDPPPRIRTRHGHRVGRSLEPLVLVPIVLMAVTPPLPLGVTAASMQPAARAGPIVSAFPRLPASTRGAVSMTVSEFIGRALYDVDASLAGARVRLVGMSGAEPGAPAGGFLLVRFAMFCCAADAIAMRVRVRGGPSPPLPENAWVEVVGTWRPAPPAASTSFDPSAEPVLDAISVRRVPEPSDPYDPPA